MLEHGAYRLLLDRYYATEKGIPDDQAHRLARARSRDERQAVDAVLNEFFQLVNGLWINSRAEEEIVKARVKISAAQSNGKKGGRPKKPFAGSENKTKDEPTGLFAGSENETQQKAHQAPSTKHQAPDLKPVDGQAAATDSRDAAALPSSDPITSRAIELSCLLRHRGAALQASNPKVRSWAERGITDAQALTALEVAEQRRADQATPQPVNAGLIDAILSDIGKPGARASPAVSKFGREGRISNYAAEAAAARGEHEHQHSTAGTERDITGESVRIA